MLDSQDINQSGPDKGMLEDWISRHDLAISLGVSEDTLWRWDAKRTGPQSIKLGRKVYYRRSAHVNTLIATSGDTITARARWLVRNNGYPWPQTRSPARPRAGRPCSAQRCGWHHRHRPGYGSRQRQPDHRCRQEGCHSLALTIHPPQIFRRLTNARPDPIAQHGRRPQI